MTSMLSGRMLPKKVTALHVCWRNNVFERVLFARVVEQEQHLQGLMIRGLDA